MGWVDSANPVHPTQPDQIILGWVRPAGVIGLKIGEPDVIGSGTGVKEI